ncbi:hypothetical protein K458DRAFT_387987 [Lentithecium fluviatile CBS 122367]|uniref:DUF6604 domain-containing protein n=1 Tax=Lentithecium fluviatile CBS 122367 TaxID=1168545 RepID=A0A6G1J3I9_9PLEO|nr:hypothetical protein K458DRAFT_387987 [Lentithecium fluviatile CBS 122367]
MLPKNLVSSYQQYKNDTEYVYLIILEDVTGGKYVSTAKSKSAKRRAKGKTGKTAPPQSSQGRPTYTVAIKDFKILAESLAPPPFVCQIMRRSNSPTIGVFSFSGFYKEAPKSMSDIINMFEDLELKEASKTFENGSDVAATPFVRAETDANYKSEQLENLEEDFLAFYLLLSDLNKLRTEVDRKWEGYKQGMLDLVTASITTNTAVDLARSLEEECNGRFKKYGGTEAMLPMLHNAQCLQAGTTEAHKPGYLPDMKLGYYGHYDPSSNRSEKRVQELSPAEDELERGLCHMLETKSVPLWLAFATTLFLDIYHILWGRVDYCFKKLGGTPNFARATMEKNLAFHAEHRIDNWPKQHDDAMKGFSE